MATKTDIDTLKQQFADFLRKKQYRNTQERGKVIERIVEMDRHFSADELYMFMNGRGDRISRATVYSTLDLLTKCSILMKHRFQGESAHYELASRMPNHDHLICVECGRIVEFREQTVDTIGARVARELGMSALNHSLQIFAVCPDPVTCEYNKGDEA